jgi:hypothetical protein
MISFLKGVARGRKPLQKKTPPRIVKGFFNFFGAKIRKAQATF